MREWAGLTILSLSLMCLPGRLTISLKLTQQHSTFSFPKASTHSSCLYSEGWMDWYFINMESRRKGVLKGDTSQKKQLVLVVSSKYLP